MLAWHFTGTTLRDGSPIPKAGKWLEFKGELIMCHQGLHASLHPLDALRYAPGPLLHQVECGGQIIQGDDKLVCSRRKIIRSMDATEMLHYVARMQALSVVHLWDAPDVVLDYLMTGDESIREAALEAAHGAAHGAALDAACGAWGAARDATLNAAWGAWGAWCAARNAAWDAALNAAWNATARKDFSELVNECFS